MLRVMLGVSLFVECMTVYTYCRILFSSTKKVITELSTFLITFLLLFFLHGFESPISVLINILLFIITLFLIFILFYKQHIITALLRSLLITGYSVISEVITGNICSLFIAKYWSDWKKENNLLYMSASTILFFLITTGTALTERKLKKKHPAFNGIIPVAILSAITFAMIVTDYIHTFLIDPNSEKTIASLHITVLTILLLGFFSMYIYMYKTIIVMSHREQQKQAEIDNIDYYKELSSRDIKQRIVIHDIKKHLISIKRLNEKKDYDSLNSYIDQLVDSPVFEPAIRYCNNDYINSILFRYKKQAEENGISFVINSAPIELLRIDNYDITVILCNLLDNAVEAAQQCFSPLIKISFSCDTDKELETISIVNSCSQKVKFSNGIPISTKKNAFAHGLGTKSILHSLEKYTGNLIMYQDPDYSFHSVVVISNGGKNENCDM